MAVFVEGLRHISGSIYRAAKDSGVSQSAMRSWRLGEKEPELRTIAKVFARYPEARAELFDLLEATIDLYVEEMRGHRTTAD